MEYVKNIDLKIDREKATMEKIKIIAPRNNGLNEAERLELGKLLMKAGFTVRVGSETKNGRTVYFVEFWTEEK